MRNFVIVQSEFGVQRTTKIFFLIDNHYKLFTNQSELIDLPTGCMRQFDLYGSKKKRWEFSVLKDLYNDNKFFSGLG